MPLFNSIRLKLSNLPINTPIVSDTGKFSFEGESFNNDVYINLNSIMSRSFPSFLYNPDFNILGAGGYTPVTQADGTDAELVSNWFIASGGGTNTYTITPTAYTPTEKSPSGSLNYLNVDIANQDSALYFYNINYPSVAQFNAASKYNGQLLALSVGYRNNSGNAIKVNFTADVPTLGAIASQAFTLKPDAFFASGSIQIPNLEGVNLGANPYIQFRLNIQSTYGLPANFDLLYIKGEISNTPTLLEFDHVLEQLRCQNLA